MERTIIIAEAGVNHNGDIEIAKKLVEVAAKAGADYVKFQTFKAEKLVSKTAKKAAYQVNNTKNNDSQFNMLKKLELSEEDHDMIIDHCAKHQIKFLSTAFDLDSIDYLSNKIDCYKIPSGEITNRPYLEKVASLNLPTILSTGMATLEEIKAAISVLTEKGLSLPKITVLHCNTEYPTPMEDVNLTAMQTIQEACSVKVGYSDHTLGIEIPVAAVAMGAVIIEKHFTLDKKMAGPDHKASLSPSELENMVSAIRNIESAMGNGIKTPSQSEQKNLAVARKSIIASKAIKIGNTFTEDNLTIKRPGTGISPMKWYDILGRKAKRDYESEDLIVEE
ncbi:MAG: N-acetylneuraminate synthase [Putridiphycobacter sp.]|nr:N-acetylneuraminate synthase [Putridiphycobacter sp.]